MIQSRQRRVVIAGQPRRRHRDAIVQDHGDRRRDGRQDVPADEYRGARTATRRLQGSAVVARMRSLTVGFLNDRLYDEHIS